MKVVILNTSESIGGAAIAAKRLMQALRRYDVDAGMLVRDKQTQDPDVASINHSFLGKKINQAHFLWERAIIYLNNKRNRADLFRVSIANTGTDISKHPLIKEADIIHLHWINQGFLSLHDIKKLIGMGKPLVWTMHDMWPCTGICHHARECTHYHNECGNCFHLNSSNKRDLSQRIFLKKKEIWQNGQITFVGCSNWLVKRAGHSAIMQGFQTFSIPNPINIGTYRKTNKEKARKRLGLPQDKNLLLFGAVNATDKRKGLDYLMDGIRHVKGQHPDIYRNLELVIFGQIKSDVRTFFDIPIHILNFLKDEAQIVNLYNAVDLFVTSSLEENLPNSIMEAMACGTPCVGFHIGGIPEMIDHKRNGYVAKYQDAEDLTNGIAWCLNNQERLGNEALKKAATCYSEEKIAGQYINIYNALL
jgi:glycosyltransferase involved in cell wall biosynthesis